MDMDMIFRRFMLCISLLCVLVYSYNTLTGETELREVTKTISLQSNHINYLTIEDEFGVEQTIETTDGHPFWVVTNDPDMNRAAREVVDENGAILYHENIEAGLNGFWVEAKDLRVGDVFLGANGELSTLTNAIRIEQDGGIAVFNFSVEGNHNYFIIAKDDEYGQSCVLVHNARYDDWKSSGRHTPKNPAEEGAIQDILDNPLIGKRIDGLPLKDPRCPAGQAFEKYEYIKNKGKGKEEIVIHYVMNIFDNPPKPLDIKFKNP